MELVYNGITTKKSSLAEDIIEASKYDFAGVELRDYKLMDYLKENSLDTLNELLNNNNSKVLAINTLEIFDYSTYEKNNYNDLEEKLIWLCEIADHIGAPYLITAPLLNESASEYEDIKRYLIDLYRRLSDIALKYKVKLGFEFISHSDAMVPTLEKALDIINSIDRVNVGLIFDMFAFYGNDSKIESIKEIPIDKLYLVHLNDAEKGVNKVDIQEKNRIFPGEGVIPLNKIIPELKNIGYDGAYSLELITPKIWEWDTSEAIKHSYDTAYKVISQFY